MPLHEGQGYNARPMSAAPDSDAVRSAPVKCSLCGEQHGTARPCAHPLARLLGTTVDGRYKIEGVLGRGGMGVVFHGVQTSVQRRVAIKMLNPSLAESPMFFERFKREAELASRLHHPNIITIYDFGRSAEGLCYYVMELLGGHSLRSLVRLEGPLPIARAVRIVEQIARALANAHGQGVIHRDLKPHNVMVSNVDGADHCKVLDFGLVKMMEEEAEGEQLTTTGQVLGTPAYMAPEQAAGDPCDQRADLYSLGVCLFYCLAGSTPFRTNSAQKALMFLMTNELPTVASRRVGAPIPESLENFIRRSMAFHPDDRPASAEQFIEEMRAALVGLSDEELNAKPTGKVDAPDLNSGLSKASSGSRPAGATAVARPLSLSRVGSNDPASNIYVAGSQLAGPATVQTELVTTAEGAARSKLPLAIGGGLLVVGAVAAALVLGRKEAVVPQPEPTAGVIEVQSPVVEAPAKPTSATVRIETEPAGAQVFKGDELLGVTPATLILPREPVNFTLKLEGYQPQTRGVDLASATEGETTAVKVTLTPEPKPKPAAEVRQPAKPRPAASKPKGDALEIPIFD